MADKRENTDSEEMEIEQKPPSPSESASEEEAELSEDDSANEEQNEELARQLEKSLSQNPYAYDVHTQLIDLFKSMGELERLREARERMSKLFPLTDALWLSWIKDEIKLISSDDDRKNVIALFEQAVKDYLSVELWLEWAQFSIGGMSGEGGVEAVRSIFERSLTNAGLHVQKGSVLWEAYREFENVMLSMHPEGSKEHEEQRARILTLFRRQLNCPLLDMDATWEELKDWAKQGEVTDIKRGYERAMEKLKSITTFEEELLRKEGDDKVAVYLSYIEHEKQKGDPARVQLMYERAAADFALNADVWLGYVTFVDRDLNIPHVATPVCLRALRNVPWDARLWVAAMRSGERHGQEHIQIQGMLEQALGAGLATASDYRQVWEAYLDYLRRRVPWDEPGEVRDKSLKELRDCTARAIEHLFQMFGVDGDPECVLSKTWAHCEASRGDMEKCRELWNEMLNYDTLHSTAAAWLEFLNLERHYGDAKHARKLFARALNATKDWPESIGQAWLSYERDQGTLEYFEAALEKTEARMKKAAEDREKEKANQKPSKFQKQKLKRKWDDTGRQEGPSTSFHQDRPQGREKQTWGKLQPPSQPMGRRERPGLGFKEAKGPPPPGFKEPRVPPPPGFKEPKVAPPPGFKPEDRDSPDHKKSKDSLGDGPVEHNSSKDNRTVFVSNLDFETTEEELKQNFESVGKVIDLRLVKDFKGRSKGFCYIELSTVDEACDALKKDREPINGRPMFVSKCDPDRQTRQKVFKYNLGMEKNKLFVKGLPLAMTREELQAMFEAYGTLKDVRLVTYRNGHSKGLAYVDFEDEAAASQALLQTDGKEIDGRVISVAISRPPERKQTSLLAPDIQSLGGKPRDAAGPSRGGRLSTTSLMPRSVRLTLPMEVESSSSTANGTDQTSTEAPPTSTAPKRSNADFRAMLLGKK